MQNLRSRLALLAILVATAATFWSSLEGRFVYDDLLLVGQNPLISDLGRLPELFLRPYWDFLRPEDSAQVGYWRPLTAVGLALASALGSGAPYAFHALSLALHVLATGATWSLARRLSGSTWVAACTALLFGLHPVHVESVAWISALNDPLFGLFALLSLERYLAWRERGSRGLPWAAPLLFAVALLAKELAAAVLPLLLALDLGRRRAAGEERGPWGGLARPLAAYAPFVLVFLAYYATRIVVFGSFWAGYDRTTTDFGVSDARLALLRVELLGGALELLAWPVELVLFRPFRPFLEPLDPALLRACAWILAWIAGTAWIARRSGRPALAALLFLPAGLLPVLLRVESLGHFPLSDRFLYLPVFGFALLAALALIHLLPRQLATAAALVLGALYALRDVTRLPVWHDEERLFRASARETPRSVYVQWGLGRVLLDRFVETEDPALLDEAFLVFEQAKDLLIEAKQERESDLFVTSRDYLQVNLGSGWCHLLAAERDEYNVQLALGIFGELLRAVTDLRDRELEAAALGIRVRSSHLEVEQVLTALGAAHMQAGQLAEARQQLGKALEANPAYPEAHQTLGRVHARLEEWPEAIRAFEAAARLRPGAFEDRLLLAQAVYESGDVARAAQLADELVERYPERADAHVLRATIDLSLRDWFGALRRLDRALALDPSHGFAWYQRGMALALREALPEAAEAYRRAAELLPDNFEAHYNLGALLLRLGLVADALPVLIRAYALCPDEERAAQLRSSLADLAFESPGPLFELASIDRLRGGLEESLAWVERALELDPEHGDSVFLKGRLLRELGRPDEALAWMQRGSRLLPRSFVAHAELGALLAEQGRTAEAIAELEHALALGPPAEWQEEASRAVLESVTRQLADLRARGDPPGPSGGG